MEINEPTAILRDLCYRAADANLWVEDRRIPVILYSITSHVRAILLSPVDLDPGTPVRCLGISEQGGVYAFETRVHAQKDECLDLEIPSEVVRMQRRQGIRMTVSLRCSVKRGTELLDGTVHDIGFGGLRMRGVEGLAVGDPVTITVYLESPVTVTGVVSRIDEGGIAVAFDINGQDRIAKPLTAFYFSRLAR